MFHKKELKMAEYVRNKAKLDKEMAKIDEEEAKLRSDQNVVMWVPRTVIFQEGKSCFSHCAINCVKSAVQYRYKKDIQIEGAQIAAKWPLGNTVESVYKVLALEHFGIEKKEDKQVFFCIEFERVPNSRINDALLKDLIIKYGAFAVSLNVPDQFIDYRNQDFDERPTSNVHNEHYVMAYGYEERGDGFWYRCRNSYGKQWGVEGDVFLKICNGNAEIYDVTTIKQILMGNKTEIRHKRQENYQANAAKERGGKE